jgi:hypothetical protein
VIKEALTDFEMGSGQVLNVNKCSIIFGDNYPEPKQQVVRQILEVSRENFEDKYIGYPILEGRMNKGKFNLPKKGSLKR